jgi:hypothetical protein
MEQHVIDIVEIASEIIGPRMPAAALVAMTVAELPTPGGGKRDTRQQVVVRALNSLARSERTSLRLEGGFAVFG